jgi:molybdopterin-guanine dinucleotide biosynthesis protein A
MEFGGKKVLDRLLEILGRFPFQELAVVAHAGQSLDIPPGVKRLSDEQEGLGPIGGVATALRRLPGALLVTACDMPLVSVDVVDWLLGEFDGRADAVVPRRGGAMEPLLAIYAKSLLPELDEAITRRRYALHSLLESCKVKFVDVPDRYCEDFANINTPEDYKRLLKRAGEG